MFWLRDPVFTVEIVSGAVLAVVAGGSRRKIGSSQVTSRPGGSNLSADTAHFAISEKSTAFTRVAPFPSAGQIPRNEGSWRCLSMLRASARICRSTILDERLESPLDNHRANPTTDVRQALQLDASASVDLDEISEQPLDFTWRCESDLGGDCLSPMGDSLDMSSSANDAKLSIAAGSLPVGTRSACLPQVVPLRPRTELFIALGHTRSRRKNDPKKPASCSSGVALADGTQTECGISSGPGVEYVFTVTVSKGAEGGTAWSQRRSDNASCTVSTMALGVPLVSVSPKVSREALMRDSVFFAVLRSPSPALRRPPKSRSFGLGNPETTQPVVSTIRSAARRRRVENSVSLRQTAGLSAR